jgi:hypothetical protein
MAPILRLGAGVAVALVLLPVAGSGGAAGSGLYGTVRKGPVTPVCQQGVPCDAPAQLTLVFTRTNPDGTAQSTQKWRLRSTEQGKYRIALDSGFYTVRSTVKIGMTKLPKPHAVHVRAGHWDKINLFFDTGIR